jgi:hypothetical protein
VRSSTRDLAIKVGHLASKNFSWLFRTITQILTLKVTVKSQWWFYSNFSIVGSTGVDKAIWLWRNHRAITPTPHTRMLSCVLYTIPALVQSRNTLRNYSPCMFPAIQMCKRPFISTRPAVAWITPNIIKWQISSSWIYTQNYISPCHQSVVVSARHTVLCVLFGGSALCEIIPDAWNGNASYI